MSSSGLGGSAQATGINVTSNAPSTRRAGGYSLSSSSPGSLECVWTIFWKCRRRETGGTDACRRSDSNSPERAGDRHRCTGSARRGPTPPSAQGPVSLSRSWGGQRRTPQPLIVQWASSAVKVKTKSRRRQRQWSCQLHTIDANLLRDSDLRWMMVPDGQREKVVAGRSTSSNDARSSGDAEAPTESVGGPRHRHLQCRRRRSIAAQASCHSARTPRRFTHCSR